MTGQPKAASSACMICGGSEAEEERMKRKGRRWITSRLRSARARIV